MLCFTILGASAYGAQSIGIAYTSKFCLTMLSQDGKVLHMRLEKPGRDLCESHDSGEALWCMMKFPD